MNEMKKYMCNGIDATKLVVTEDNRCPNCDAEDEYKEEREIVGRINTLIVLECGVCGYLFLEA